MKIRKSKKYNKYTNENLITAEVPRDCNLSMFFPGNFDESGHLGGEIFGCAEVEAHHSGHDDAQPAVRPVAALHLDGHELLLLADRVGGLRAAIRTRLVGVAVADDHDRRALDPACHRLFLF